MRLKKLGISCHEIDQNSGRVLLERTSALKVHHPRRGAKLLRTVYGAVIVYLYDTLVYPDLLHRVSVKQLLSNNLSGSNENSCER